MSAPYINHHVYAVYWYTPNVCTNEWSPGRLPERPCSLGDSMVRHVFMRLMHWIQGRTTPCEHYFHASAAYWMTEKNDGFAVQTGGKVLAPKPAPGKMVVHYVFCGFCDPANEVKKRMKLLNGNVKLVVGSPSKWHSNAKTFYNLINTHASPARLMVLGRTEMNCGKKGRPPTMVPEYTRVNEEMNRLHNTLGESVGGVGALPCAAATNKNNNNIFFLNASGAYHHSVNAKSVFVMNSVKSDVKGISCDIHFGCIYGEEMYPSKYGVKKSKKSKKKKGSKREGGITPISFVKYATIDKDDGTKQPYFEDFSNLYFMMLAISPHCESSPR